MDYRTEHEALIDRSLRLAAIDRLFDSVHMTGGTHWNKDDGWYVVAHGTSFSMFRKGWSVWFDLSKLDTLVEATCKVLEINSEITKQKERTGE